MEMHDSAGSLLEDEVAVGDTEGAGSRGILGQMDFLTAWDRGDLLL